MRFLVATLLVACGSGGVTEVPHAEDLKVALDVDETRNCGPVAPEHIDREVVTPVFGARVLTLGFDIHEHPDPACHLDVDSIDRGFQRAIDRWESVGYPRAGLLDAVARLDHIEMLEGIPDEDSVARTEITWTGSEDDFTYVVQIPLNPFLSPGTTHPVFCTTFQHELDHVFAWALDRDNYDVVGHTTDIEGNPATPEELALGLPPYGDHCSPLEPPVSPFDGPLFWGQAGDVPMSASFFGTADDLVVYRPSNTTFYVSSSDAAQNFEMLFGSAGDIPLVADFLGRESAQLAQFRRGEWWITDPAAGDHQVVNFGLEGDLPFSGELLGPGRSDLAVFRPSDASVWIADALDPSDHLVGSFGAAGDLPFAGDFEDRGFDQVALFRPTTGTWTLVDLTMGSARELSFGLAGDVPFTGRFLSDTRSAIAVFRPSDGVVHLYDLVEERHVQFPWGVSGDVPVAGDFLGRGHDQIAQFRDGQWWIYDAQAKFDGKGTD